MSNGLVVNDKSQSEELRKENFSQHPAAVKIIAKIISYIFHPVFVPVYLVLFMVYLHPWLFVGVAPFDKTMTVIRAVLMYTFFPIVTVLLLKGLGFIKSVYLNTQKDRIIPLVACGVWYFWIWFVWRNLPEYPNVAIQLTLAVWISASLGLMTNIIMKVSLHALSMGVMLAFIFLLAYSDSLNYGPYIAIALLIAGLVCTSRFIVSDHSAKEVYGGLAVGVTSMLIANLFV